MNGGRFKPVITAKTEYNKLKGVLNQWQILYYIQDQCLVLKQQNF